MPRFCSFIAVALLLGILALLPSSPAMAHGNHTPAASEQNVTAASPEAVAVPAAATVLANAEEDEPCPCCPGTGRACCSATLALAPVVADGPFPVAGKFGVPGNGRFVPSAARHLIEQPPALA